MQTLIDIIAIRTKLSSETAALALQTVSDYVKEKYPLLADVVDSVLAPKIYAERDAEA